MRVHGVEDTRQCSPRDGPVNRIVGEFGKLVEDHIFRLLAETVTGIVNFLHVAFRARCADDVAVAEGPFFEPFEALATHALWQHRNPVAIENA